MARNAAARKRSEAATQPLRPVNNPDAEDLDLSDEEGEGRGKNPVPFVLLFFGIPFLLLLVAGIVMTPCN